MVKNCCVVGCHNVFKKNSGIQFYRFPTNPEKRSKWIAAVKRDDWAPNDNTWIYSTHFVTGKRSDNPLAPNFIPTLFPQFNSLKNESWRKKHLNSKEGRKQSRKGFLYSQMLLLGTNTLLTRMIMLIVIRRRKAFIVKQKYLTLKLMLQTTV